MARVFEDAGFPVTAPPPWPRLSYDEAMLRFGSDRPDTRFGLELADLGGELAGTEFKVFASVLDGGGVIRGLNAGAARGPALRARRAHRARQALRRRRPRLGVRAGGRHVALADRQVPLRGAGRRGHAQARRLAGRPAADRRRQAARRRDGAGRAAPRAGAPLRPRARGPPRRALGRRLPDVRVRRGRAALERPAPPVHRPDGLVRGPGRAALARLRHRARRRRRSAAGRSASTGPRSSSRSSRRSAWGRRRRSRASASCSTRCATARRRTAGSRSASTASRRSWPGRDSIRDVMAFPKTASGSDPLTGAPAAVGGGQLAELGLKVTAPPRGG